MAGSTSTRRILSMQQTACNSERIPTGAFRRWRFILSLLLRPLDSKDVRGSHGEAADPTDLRCRGIVIDCLTTGASRAVTATTALSLFGYSVACAGSFHFDEPCDFAKQLDSFGTAVQFTGNGYRGVGTVR